MKKKPVAPAPADLLVEVGCEDLPARFVRPLAQALGQVGFALANRGVPAGVPKLFATPRRIAVLVEGVAPRQADQQVERKGPKLQAAIQDGQPTPAGLGFARSCGVEFAELAQEDGQLVFRSVQKGRPTAELIPEIFEQVLKEMDQLVPKRMRWGGGEETFVRPVQWLVCLLGSKVVPLQRFGLKSSNRTFGHRFHAPKAIVLGLPAEYEEKLKAAKVVADFDARRGEIRKQVEAEAKKLKGRARITEELLDEVTALVEWPVAIHGRMDEAFMALPPEVIIATIETNQRYFPVFARERLLPFFITVANIKSKSVKQVIEGNERVVRPRLSDALFFWEQDRKRTLAEHNDGLDKVTFQKDLGTITDKVARIAKLARRVAPAVGADVESAVRAAGLCKADLVTRMVFEFPELQGIMGSYYAQASGESEDVALAIREHYQPIAAGAPVPSTPEGLAVALADKVDTLAGIFAIGQKPTASKDPYALRRAALGVLRICIEGQLAVDMRELLRAALAAQPAGKTDAPVLGELLDFVFERLRGYYAALPVEMFEAVRATGVTDVLDFDSRIQALREFWKLPEAANLAAAHKRARNILRQAGGHAETAPNPGLFEHEAERALAAELDRVVAANQGADYGARLKSLATLRGAVDGFFDGVMVNADDAAVRNNRLALLSRFDAVCRDVADISCLPG